MGTEIYFKQILQQLISNQELSLHEKTTDHHRYNNEPDFTFVVIERFLSVENELSLKEGLLLQAYFRLKALGLSDEKAFGIDRNDVVVEEVPLIVNRAEHTVLQRISN